MSDYSKHLYGSPAQKMVARISRRHGREIAKAAVEAATEYWREEGQSYFWVRLKGMEFHGVVYKGTLVSFKQWPSVLPGKEN